MIISTAAMYFCFWMAHAQHSPLLQVLNSADRLLSKETTAVVMVMKSEELSDEWISEVMHCSPVTVVESNNLENATIQILKTVQWNDQKVIVLVDDKGDEFKTLQMFLQEIMGSGILVTFVIPDYLRSQISHKRLDTRAILFDLNTTHVVLHEMYALVSGKEMVSYLTTLSLGACEQVMVADNNLFERRSAALNGTTVNALRALQVSSDGREVRECLYKGKKPYRAYQPSMVVVEFVESLQTLLNFTVSLTIMCDMEKSLTSDLSIFAQLFLEINERNDTEFIMESLTLFIQRQLFADFSPVHTMQMFLFKYHSIPKGLGINGYVQPFSTSLWLAIVGSLIALGLTVGLCDHFQSPIRDMSSFWGHCLTGIWTMFSFLIQQSPRESVTSGRTGSRFPIIRSTILIMGSFLSYLYFSLYSSTLISHLTVQLSEEHPMNDLTFFLAKESNLTVNFQSGLSKFHGVRANNSIWRNVGKRMSSDKNVIADPNKAEHFLRETPKSAWVSSLTYVVDYQWKTKPIIVQPKEFTTPFIYQSIPMRKRSQLKPLFDMFLKKYEECGLLQKSRKKWILERPSETSVEKKVTLGFKDVSLPFCIIITGFLGNILVLAIEVVCKKFSTEKRRPIHHVDTTFGLP